MPASLRGIGGSSRVGYRLLICSSMMARRRIKVEWVVVVKGCGCDRMTWMAEL